MEAGSRPGRFGSREGECVTVRRQCSMIMRRAQRNEGLTATERRTGIEG